MSERIAYIERTDQGDRLRRIRLIGGRIDVEWTPGPDLAPLQACAEAAAWIRSALADDSGRSLALVCLDAEAGLWTWITPPHEDGRLVEAMLRQAGGDALVLGLDGVSVGGETSASGLGPEVDVPGAVGVQVLAPPVPSLLSARLMRRLKQRRAPNGAEQASHARAPVFCTRDAVARVLIDELDAVGVGVGSVTSIWHALAAATDPAGPGLGGASTSTGDVVAQSEQAYGAVVLDPAGRLAWVWSHKAEVVAGGAIRLAEGSPGLRVTSSDVSRLVADWFAWAAQTGITPARVTCFCPELDPDGLSPSAFGAALASGLRDLPLDMVVTPDPIADLLTRLRGLSPAVVSPPQDARRALVDLAHRPGRSHRSMYRWAAAGLLAAAMVCGAVALKLNTTAKQSRESAADLRRQSMEIYRKYVPADPAQGSLAVMKLESVVTKLREAAPPPILFESAKPVLEELDTIMFLVPTFGQMGLELQSLVIDDIRAELVAIVNDLSMYEQFRAALDNIAGSRITWSLPITSETPDKRIRATFRGSWAPAAGGSR
ncbi:MAG: hypothetical protein KF866_10115 [Phycisphaeraceae bacterium]|nr:hypothetical protein [Phycisphaeraceae bacterium]MCW5754855.1 hypothetical protein [Phycisphaeraceae bacterium]